MSFVSDNSAACGHSIIVLRKTVTAKQGMLAPLFARSGLWWEAGRGGRLAGANGPNPTQCRTAVSKSGSLQACVRMSSAGSKSDDGVSVGTGRGLITEKTAFCASASHPLWAGPRWEMYLHHGSDEAAACAVLLRTRGRPVNQRWAQQLASTNRNRNLDASAVSALA